MWIRQIFLPSKFPAVRYFSAGRLSIGDYKRPLRKGLVNCPGDRFCRFLNGVKPTSEKCEEAFGESLADYIDKGVSRSHIL